MLKYSTSCIIAVCLLMASIAHADILQFNVAINGSQEVPANASPGTGSAIAIFDNVTGAMTINGTFSGLTSAVTAAHLHGYAALGTNAGVLFALTPTSATSGTITGSGTIPLGNIPNVVNGLTYINIHTSTFPGGEIRGQLINPIPEPCSLAVLGLAVGGMTLRRRRD